MALQCRRKNGSPTPEQFAELLSGQPLIDIDSGELYIGGCCDGRPVNASHLLNGTGQDSLMQYGGDNTASAGTPAEGKIGNSAEGKYAVALGRYVHSKARNTITLGYTSVNNSAYGTVIGRGNYSEGDNSVVIGKFNNNNGADNYVIGSFNDVKGANGCYLFGTNLTATRGNKFIIGNNNDDLHHNGYDIFQIGDGWGEDYPGNERFNLVSVLKRVRDDQGNYAYGGYMEIAIQGNTSNSVIKKSTMDAAIGNIYNKDDNEVETGVLIDKIDEVIDKVDEVENNLTTQLQAEITARENADSTLQGNIDEIDNKKADKATTLSEYGITDAYTKTETDEKLQEVNQLISDGLVVATDEKPGLIGIGYVQTGKNYPVKLENNQAYVNVPWSNTTYSKATTTYNGLMSSEDKTKLDTFKTQCKLISAQLFIPIPDYEGNLYISFIRKGFTQRPTSVTQLVNLYYSSDSRCGSLRYEKKDVYVLGFDNKNMTYMESGQVKTVSIPDNINIVYTESYIITTDSAI